MAEPINLRQYRKRKERADKEAVADDNRKKHGISTKLKNAQREKLLADIRKLDGHQRGTDISE